MCKTTWMNTGLCVGLLLSGGVAVAQGSSPLPAQAERAGTSDQEFLTRAIRTNQLELKLGHMAAERASAPEIKAMGETMVQKHSELGRQLSDLARKSGVTGAPELSPEQQATIARLGSLSGPDFDRSFKQTLGAAHVQELAMYRDEVSRANDPQLRALAQKRVATLEQTVNQAGRPKEAKPKGGW